MVLVGTCHGRYLLWGAHLTLLPNKGILSPVENNVIRIEQNFFRACVFRGVINCWCVNLDGGGGGPPLVKPHVLICTAQARRTWGCNRVGGASHWMHKSRKLTLNG